MSLRGNLNSVDLANIFQMLSINQKEGTLNIFDGESKKSIYFSRDGVSMLSRGKVKKDTLGRILLRYDKISESELDRALQMQRQSGKLLGVILEESRLVPRDVIEDALRIQIEEEIYNLFIWKDASFEFIEGISPREFEEIDGAITRLTFNVNSLIMEAARRIDEWEHIQRHLTSMGDIFRYSGNNMELTDDIFREPYCEKVLAGINGKNNVEEIIDLSHVNKFEVCKVISLLLEQRAIEPVSVEDLEQIARAAIERGEFEDGIKFYGRIIQLRGDTPEMHDSLGKAYEQIKEIAKAAHHYRLFAEHRLGAGGVEDAFAVYRRICELLPTDLQSADRMIEIFTSHPDRLADRMEEVIERGKTLATIYLELKKNSRAIQTLHRVITLAPENFSLRNLLINIYLANGMSSEAIAEYEAMADWFYRKKDWDKVIRIFRKILVIDRSREDLSHRLQQLLARKERRKKGRKRLLILVLVVLGLEGLGVAYFQYEMKARNEAAVAESDALKMLADLTIRTEGVRNDLDQLQEELLKPDPDAADLVETYQEAKQLWDQYRGQIQEAIGELERVADEYRFSTVRSQAIKNQQELDLMRTNFDQIIINAGNLIQSKAVEFVTEAEKLFWRGEVTRALRKYEQAKTLAIDSRMLKEKKVDERIAKLRSAFDTLDTKLKEQGEAIANGEYAEARQIGLLLLDEFPQAELRERVKLPIRVESWPEGAEIQVDGKDSGVLTPGWVLISPSLGAKLTVALEGYSTVEELIPPINPEGRDPLAYLSGLQKIEKSLQKMVLWAPKLNGNVDAALTVSGKVVYLATRGSEIFRLGPTQRSLEFVSKARDISGFGAGVAATDRYLYLCSIEGPLQKLSLSTRKVVWSKDVAGMVYAPLTLSGATLIVADRKGYLTAYATDDGRQRWRRHMAGEFLTRPVVSDGKVFVTCSDDNLYVFDLATGKDVWQVAPGGDLFGAPLVHDGMVYVGSTSGTLYAYHLATRKLAWTYAVGAELRSSPVMLGDVVVVGGLDGTLAAIRDGRLIERVQLDGAVCGAPTVSGSRLYACTDAGLVLSAELAEGTLKVRWRYILKGEQGTALRIAVPAVVVDGRVVIAAESGEVFILSE